jgi:hypothetical protein
MNKLLLSALLTVGLFGQLPEYSPHHIGESLQDWTIVNHAPVISNVNDADGTRVIATLDKRESATWTFTEGKLTNAQIQAVEHPHKLRNTLIVIAVAAGAGTAIYFSERHKTVDYNTGFSAAR